MIAIVPNTEPIAHWQLASWETYLAAIATAEQATSRSPKGYYYQGRMYLEMAAIGNPHARDHYIILAAIALYSSLLGLDLDGHDNCTYRRSGELEVQPDASFHVGDRANLIPWDETIVDLDRYPAPDLAIEVAYSSLGDDLGEKRLIYEEIGVQEYWVVDVQNVRLLTFSMIGKGSERITRSRVLPGLDLTLLQEAFHRSRTTNHGQVTRWLLQEFQQAIAADETDSTSPNPQ